MIRWPGRSRSVRSSSYKPESHADFVNVARTIAFSMAALALLGKAAREDVTMTEKMRVYGRANALNRSADQSERTMMQRRRQQAKPPMEQPTSIDAGYEYTDFDEEAAYAEIDAAVAEALNAHRAQNANAKAAPPKTPSTPSILPTASQQPAPAKATSPQPAPARQPKQPAIAGSPSTTAFGASGSPTVQHPTPSLPAAAFKEGLMQNSAIQRTMNTGDASQPR